MLPYTKNLIWLSIQNIMACFGYTAMLLYLTEEESDWQCTLEYIEIKPNKVDGLSSAQKKVY
mgnify:FL=1